MQRQALSGFCILQHRSLVDSIGGEVLLWPAEPEGFACVYFVDVAVEKDAFEIPVMGASAMPDVWKSSSAYEAL